MPGAIRTCFLCGRSNRSSFSSYMKIDCLEQERRIQEGYRQRYKINLDDSLIDKQVHRLCYRSIIQRQPPARFRSVSHPYKYARCSRHRLSQTQSHSVTLIDNSVQCLNEHEQIDNASHRSLDITNNKENCLARDDDNICEKTADQVLTSDRSISRSSKPFHDLTNRSSMTSDRMNEFSNLSIDSYHSFSPTSPDFRQSFLQNTISCSVTNANDRSPIDTDTDEDLFSTDKFDVFPFDPLFPSTSTEKNPRAIPFLQPDDHTIGMVNSADSSVRHQHSTCTNSDESMTPILQDERQQAKSRYSSRNDQRPEGDSVSSCRRIRASSRPKPSRRSTRPVLERLNDSLSTCDAASRLFSNAFDELCAWLFDLLEGGALVPMTELSSEYERILQRRNETCTESMLRTSHLRQRLECNYADVSTYVQLALSTSDVWKRPLEDNDDCQRKHCETMMNTIDQLRKAVKAQSFLFQKFKSNRQSIVDFDQSLFWSCVPMLLKNFIGMVTLSEDQFQKLKMNHDFYDLTTKDLFSKSWKSLKIASISYDIINALDEKAITPKHLLLANEIFHHTRSAKLLKMTNRLGHTCSYDTVGRLHHEAAEQARQPLNLMTVARKRAETHQQNFLVKVADNFDQNPDGIHGNVKNIHILGQILVNTAENDETPAIIRNVLDEMVNCIVKSTDASSIVSVPDVSDCSSSLVVNTSCSPYSPFVDDSFKNVLLGYGLTKLFVDVVLHGSLPLLSGFFATYLPSCERPLHTVTFLTPINDDPSAESTAETCLISTKETLLGSKYQNEAVLVVDEKIYRSCVKVKRRRPDLDVFIYPGDFHFMKNTMVVIWDVLSGSGIEEILGTIYRGASLRSILNVHHFNKSLRCCKLVYTSLLVLLLETFFAAETDAFDNLEAVLGKLPNEFSKDTVKQQWFTSLIGKMGETDFHDKFHKWCIESAKSDSMFRLWSFITFSLFEPLIELYMAIRTGNFQARNAAVSRIAPLFFSTNHRNYARLCAQHLVDLKSGSAYLINRLSRSFAVNRTNRPFSYIALDQTIECTMNKYGKSHGGIDGRFSGQTVEQWMNSFSFRALASAVMHEICQMETAGNSIDSHVECAPNRQEIDHQDLTLIIRSLRSENVFSMKNSHCTKLRSGMIIHKDIVESICSLNERGTEALLKYIDERLINKPNKIDVDAPLKAIPRLKLTDADSYVPSDPNSQKKCQSLNMAKIIKEADEEIRRIIIIAQQRKLLLTPLMVHEFAPTSLALCDSRNADLFNQQSKSTAIHFLRELFPSAFYSSYPVPIVKSALIIDGGSLLEIKPLATCRTIRDYADQLLKYTIGNLFKEHNRIDVVFDGRESKAVKMFTKRHVHDVNLSRYQLKGSDKLESPFSTFVHSNRAALASCVRECWCDPSLINIIPPNCLLVVGGPGKTAVKLQNGSLPIDENLLESNHIEADTRMMLHMNVVKIDNEQDTVIIQSSDTDVILLAIAFASGLGMNSVFIKSFDTRTKKNTIIDVKMIGYDMRRRLKVDPIVLLILHALSGCDTNSFIKGITKKKIFSTFFNDPVRYSKLTSFISTPPCKEAISIAEQLLIDCYSSRFVANILDELRANMAAQYFKESGRRSIVTNLPPSSNAFYYHCLRASRQIVIWLSSFDQYMNPPAMALSGYQPTEVTNRFKIQWSSLPAFSDDPRLVTCGQCSSGCTRCKCGTNKLSCTIYCQCKPDCCTNQPLIHMNHHSPNTKLMGFDDSDEDVNLTTQWPMTSEDEGDGVSIASNASICDADCANSDDGSEEMSSVDSTTCALSTSMSLRNTTAINDSSASHVTLDHSYCSPSSPDTEQATPHRTRQKCNDYRACGTRTPTSTINRSLSTASPNRGPSMSPTTSESTRLQSPRPKARFLKHFRPRLPSSNS